jgi:hypothetical protein
MPYLTEHSEVALQYPEWQFCHPLLSRQAFLVPALIAALDVPAFFVRNCSQMAVVEDFKFYRCFLIMDNMIDNEMAEPHEIPLFFYPPGKDLSKQLSTISVCLAMSSIVTHFTHVPVCALSNLL